MRSQRRKKSAAAANKSEASARDAVGLKSPVSRSIYGKTKRTGSSHPARSATRICTPCLMTLISFVQTRFTLCRPIYSARYAEKDAKIAQKMTMSSPVRRSERVTSEEQRAAKTAPGTVSSSCMPHFARSAVHASTGSDRETQSDLPSSDTLGTAMSFIEQTRHTAAVSSTGTEPPEPKTSPSTSATAPPRTSRRMPAMGSRSVLKPQLSI